MGFASLLLVLTALFIFIQVSSKDTEGTNGGFHISEEERKQLANLMALIKISLHEAKYGGVLDHAVLPNKNIEIIVKLERLKVDEKTKEDIKKIATNVIKQNDFDPKTFQYNITSFYDAEKDGSQNSQRLSYNDLMGDIMLSLNKKGYAVAVQGQFTSDKKVVISLVLPHDQFDEKSKTEVQKIAKNVIAKYKFNPELFRFKLSSYSNSS